MAATDSITIILWFLMFLSSNIILAKPLTNSSFGSGSSLGSVEKPLVRYPCTIIGRYLKCRVPVLDNNIDFSVYTRNITVLKIYCGTVMPSRLLDGFFEPLGDSFRYISIYDCYFVSISRNAFRGLNVLESLWIDVGSNFDMDGCGVQLSNVSTMIRPPQPGHDLHYVTVRCSHDNLVLPDGIFSELKGLYTLILEAMRLNSSIWHELENLSYLKYLSLFNNDITTIDITTISKLKKLQTLYLDRNNIQTILNGTFEPLSDLRLLDLSRNRIRFLERGAFNTLISLGKLYLSQNLIRTIENSTFFRTTKLGELDLSRNEIDTVSQQALSQLRYLWKLNMSYNYIETLPIFPSSLETLDLRNNKIAELSNSSFAGLFALSEVNLGFNGLVRLPEDVFRTNSKLQLLNLSFNHIVQLPALPGSIEVLDLRNNNLVNLSKNPFEGLYGLSEVNLGSNGLVQLSEGVFWTNLNLQRLDLSGNEIVQIPSLPRSLESLELSQNRIREWTLNNIPKLTNLSSNDLSMISFNLTPNLTYVDLRNNKLSSVTIGGLKEYRYARGSGDIYLAGNGDPFQCVCNLEVQNKKLPFTYDSRNNAEYRIRNLTSLKCSSVNSFGATEIPAGTFMCNTSCHSNCTCYHWHYKDYINIVNCLNAGLTSVPVSISDSCTILDLSGNVLQLLRPGNFDGLSQLVELYLNASNLRKITEFTFRELSSLTKLDLSNNNISRLNPEMFKGLSSLSFLDLSSNRINAVVENTFKSLNKLNDLYVSINELSAISSSDIKSLYELASLKLSNNPWTCDCSFIEQLAQLNTKSKVLLVDKDNITCLTADKTELYFANIYIPEFCPNTSDIPDTTGVIVGSCAGVFVITVISLIVLFKKRKLLKVCCFVHFGRMFGCLLNDEQDRQYDAFVAFSSWDAAFIARELMPRLEGPRPGQQGYTLCVHFRDFPVGAPIAETILDVVDNSRRVIIILSDNFLRSEWCHFEFQAAHFKLLREKKNRIIMVLLHDINTDLLDNHLSMFLSTRTYVKYGDPLFWSKIEYAMPKRKPATDDNLNADNIDGEANNLPAAVNEDVGDDVQLIT